MSDDNNDLFKYAPSVAAAGTSSALFALTTGLHMWQAYIGRTWYFSPFIVGGWFQVVGYAFRAVSATEYPNQPLPPYIVQYLGLLLAPSLYAASIYMVLGRIIRLTNAHAFTLVKAQWITKIFVAGDVVSFLMQMGGGGVLASSKTESGQDLGELLITIGLIVQLIFFGFFIVVSINFHYRLRSNPTDASRKTSFSWEIYLYILYIGSILIMVRSIFRVIEYVQGQDGPLLSKEWYLYVFDTALMFLTMVLFNVKHPSIILLKHTSAKSEADTESGSNTFLMKPIRISG
ncbi:Rta-like protein [Neofusicoccum parvum]|nr:Rta-like protein [Neofusicoccum parvum]